MMLKAHRNIIVQTVLIGIVISTYDMLLDSLLTLAHLAFEWFELGLKELIEHVFHTTRHQSQVIVFYLLLSVVFARALSPVARVASISRLSTGCSDALYGAYGLLLAGMLFPSESEIDNHLHGRCYRTVLLGIYMRDKYMTIMAL